MDKKIERPRDLEGFVPGYNIWRQIEKGDTVKASKLLNEHYATLGEEAVFIAEVIRLVEDMQKTKPFDVIVPTPDKTIPAKETPIDEGRVSLEILADLRADNVGRAFEKFTSMKIRTREKIICSMAGGIGIAGKRGFKKIELMRRFLEAHYQKKAKGA